MALRTVGKGLAVMPTPGGGLGSVQRLLDGAPSRRHDDDARGDDDVGNWDGCILSERQHTC